MNSAEREPGLVREIEAELHWGLESLSLLCLPEIAAATPSEAEESRRRRRAEFLARVLGVCEA